MLLKLSFTYFAMVFSAGFLLGVIRVLWLAPHLGERTAELIETPVMLGIIVYAARYLVNRWHHLLSLHSVLISGIIALALLLVLEFTVVLYARDLTLSDYFATRDPVSGTVYAVSLLLFAIMPTGVFLRNRQN